MGCASMLFFRYFSSCSFSNFLFFFQLFSFFQRQQHYPTVVEHFSKKVKKHLHIFMFHKLSYLQRDICFFNRVKLNQKFANFHSFSTFFKPPATLFFLTHTHTCTPPRGLSTGDLAFPSCLFAAHLCHDTGLTGQGHGFPWLFFGCQRAQGAQADLADPAVVLGDQIR